MGDSRACAPPPTHHYLQHTSAINLEQEKVQQPSVAALQLNPSPSPSPALFAQSHAQGLPLLVQTAQPHTYLPWYPLQQPARPAKVQPASALALPCPTVVVSPHCQSPPTERQKTRQDAKKSFTHSSKARTQLDGNSSVQNGVPRSAPSMTSNGALTMGGRREDQGTLPRNQRPSVVSQHSSSVPSTPLQLARQYESRSRSPSPNGGLGSHSPRSVSSEANGPMPTLRGGRVHRCKYETSAMFGRRRIPYVSSDTLEKAKEEPKKTLDPHEDEKLSGDMRELYDRLLPDQESTDRRRYFVKKLERILHAEWPGNEFKVHVFGSSGNDLYTSESDVDVCIQTPMKRLEEMHMLAEALDRHGMEKVVCVPQAKVRIVKIWDPELSLACDMNVNNTLALENTRMIKTYVSIDERVRPLAMIVKHWTKQRILNDAALGGTISSYTWICMILNFLQTRSPPIIPSLHKLPYRKIDETTGAPSQSEFADDLEKLRGFGSENKESLGQLLFHFFRVYGHEIDYEKYVISVREGRLLTREEKTWDLVSLKKEARNRLCVEEPFNTERNLGNSADDFAWRGIHLEIRRAFDLLADGGQLDKACEQFEFPPEEKSSGLFKRPTSSVKTVLQSAPSGKNGRGGYGHRGGRGGFHQKGNHGGQRRSSSGAAFGANRPPFLHSPPIVNMASSTQAQEYFPRGLNEQLHDQLYQQYLSLEMQSNSLRAQLAAQQRVQQAHQVHAAQMHAQAVAQAQAQAQAQAHHRGQSSTNGSPQKSPFVTGHGSPRLPEMSMQAHPLHQQFLYHYPTYLDHTQGSAASASQDGPRTNPSSPSMAHSVMRRAVHRTSNASDTASSIRSHSQPPRGGPQQALPPGYPPLAQFFDPVTFAGYPIARSTQEEPTSQPVSEAPYSPLSAYPETAASSDHSTPKEYPKEYVGYYVADPPHTRAQLQDYTVQQIPSYNDIVQRRRRVSPEITQPLLNTALRRVSRSPSPLGGHVRSYSTGVTQPSSANNQQRKDHIDSVRPPDNSGPVIVNGSFPAQQARESRNRSETVDALPALDANHSAALGIYVSPGDRYQLSSPEHRQQYVPQELQHQKPPEMMNASIVNGSLTSASPVETNGLSRVSSGGQQPFPALPESWMNYDSISSDKSSQSTDISPTRSQPPQWPSVPYTNGLRSLDTMNAPRAPPQEIKSAGLPLLSPVFETRTPSPTASRQHDMGKPINGTKGHAKENQQQQRRASHAPGQSSTPKENGRGNLQKSFPQNHDKSNKNGVGPNNQNGSWQSTGTGKRKNKKKNNKGPEQKTSGEPVPANPADRKGG